MYVCNVLSSHDAELMHRLATCDKCSRRRETAGKCKLTEAWPYMCIKVVAGTIWDVGKLVHNIRPCKFKLIPEFSDRSKDCGESLKGNVICIHAISVVRMPAGPSRTREGTSTGRPNMFTANHVLQATRWT